MPNWVKKPIYRALEVQSEWENLQKIKKGPVLLHTWYNPIQRNSVVVSPPNQVKKPRSRIRRPPRNNSNIKLLLSFFTSVSGNGTTHSNLLLPAEKNPGYKCRLVFHHIFEMSLSTDVVGEFMARKGFYFNFGFKRNRMLSNTLGLAFPIYCTKYS